MFIIFCCLRVARSQGLRVFLTLCLCVFTSLRLCDFVSLRLCDFATLRLCDLFDCKNIMKNLSRQTDNFDDVIDFVDKEKNFCLLSFVFRLFLYLHKIK